MLKLLRDALQVELPAIAALGFEYIDVHTMEVLESDNLFEIDRELMSIILQRDSLHDGLEEIQLYLACLRWARGSGTLDYFDKSQYSLPENLEDDVLSDLKAMLKHIRLPLIPTQILVKEVHPSGLIEPAELFIASAY